MNQKSRGRQTKVEEGAVRMLDSTELRQKCSVFLVDLDILKYLAHLF